MATLCQIAADQSASVTTRMKSVNALLRYADRIAWKADAAQAEAVAKFLLTVSNDSSRGESTRQKASAYLAHGATLRLWKLPT